MEENFQKHREEITTAFNKKPFDKKRGFQVWTDTSKEGGFGYLVAQEEGDWTEHREGGMRINRILVDMARNCRKDKKYMKCIEATKWEGLQKKYSHRRRIQTTLSWS